MSSDSQRAVKVHLEVDIPQGGPAPAADPERVNRPLFARPIVTQPTPTQVRARRDTTTGNWIICTQGTADLSTRYLFARVFRMGDAQAVSPVPPSGAAWQFVDPNNGQWGVQTPFELPVADPTGNNTFVAWADSGTQYRSALVNFTISQGTGTECNPGSASGSGSGSGGGGGLVPLAALGVSLPTTLYAHVSNAGALSGAHALIYDPHAKAWASDAICGPHGFRLLCVGTNWQLTVKGPKTYHPSIAQCGPSPPFQIVFHDVGLSAPGHGGAAKVTVEILLSGG